jgi:hypothetical protein
MDCKLGRKEKKGLIKAGSFYTVARKKKKTGWLHSRYSRHSMETLQSTFDDATMCHIYKFKWAKHFG